MAEPGDVGPRAAAPGGRSAPLAAVRPSGDGGRYAVLLGPGAGGAVLRVADGPVGHGPYDAVLRPASLVVGVGASRGVGADEVVALVERTLWEAGLSALSLAALATVEAKAAEPGLVAAARRLGAPLTAYPAARLARVAVPHPSGAALTAVGTPSVAEAAALAGGGELLVPKRKSRPAGRPAAATCAVVRRAARGRLVVFAPGAAGRGGAGPERRDGAGSGGRDGADRTGTECRDGSGAAASGRAAGATGGGHAVVVVDADTARGRGALGRLTTGTVAHLPEGHGQLTIALTGAARGEARGRSRRDAVEEALRSALEADAVVVLHGARPGDADGRLARALAVLGERRGGGTPIGLVRNLSQAYESSQVVTLAGVDTSSVDMMTVVTVGNTATRAIAGRMVTPHGYRWQP